MNLILSKYRNLLILILGLFSAQHCFNQVSQKLNFQFSLVGNYQDVRLIEDETTEYYGQPWQLYNGGINLGLEYSLFENLSVGAFYQTQAIFNNTQFLDTSYTAFADLQGSAIVDAEGNYLSRLTQAGIELAYRPGALNRVSPVLKLRFGALHLSPHKYQINYSVRDAMNIGSGIEGLENSDGVFESVVQPTFTELFEKKTLFSADFLAGLEFMLSDGVDFYLGFQVQNFLGGVTYPALTNLLILQDEILVLRYSEMKLFPVYGEIGLKFNLMNSRKYSR